MKKLLFLLAILLAIIILLFMVKVYKLPQNIQYGVTFSPQYAKYLKLNWQATYINILDELKVKRLRLPSYWDDIEKDQGNFSFEDEDFMLSEAQKAGVKVILVIGIRQPRWPECHIPNWARDLDVETRKQKTLDFIKVVVERYRDDATIWSWQVENEPLLKSFGQNCDIPDRSFLEREVALIRSLSNKIIIMTDSGELGFWITSMKLSDVFGTTLYRQVFSPDFGYVTYPLPPYLYYVKSGLIRNLFAPHNKKTIITELQAEPWIANKDLERNPEKQTQFFPPERVKSNVAYAQKTGFDEVYLWGVEWWYFMKEHGHPEYWEFAKTLFR